jgi:hypothetical protein
MNASTRALYAASRVKPLALSNVSDTFGPLLRQDAKDLACMSGAPATVMLAQTLSYIKTTSTLRESYEQEDACFKKIWMLAQLANKHYLVEQKKGNVPNA